MKEREKEEIMRPLKNKSMHSWASIEGRKGTGRRSEMLMAAAERIIMKAEEQFIFS